MMNRNRIFDFFLKFFLVIGTLFYCPIKAGTMTGDDAVNWGYMVQELFFRYGVMVLYCLAINLKPVRYFKVKEFAFFILYVLGFCLITKSFDVQARRTVLNIFCALVFFKTVYEHFLFKDIKKYAYLFGGVLLMNLVMCIFQYFGKDPLQTLINPAMAPVIDNLVGFMKLKVHAGVLAAITAPILTFISPFALVLVIPLLFISKSSVAVMAFVISSLFMLYFRVNKRVFTIILMSLVVIGTLYVLKFDMPDGQFGERFKVWFAAISDTLRGDLFFGSGIGSFTKTHFASLQKNGTYLQWAWAHNEYVQTFFEAGLFGLIIVLTFVRERVIEFFDFWDDRVTQVLFASFMVIAMVSFFHIPFHLGRFAGVCLFLMAIYSARIEDLKNGG